ncbi:hypothetical protein KGQ72_01610 [Patescibacteria group bacterium]|nr:hypothetical protein [Patescibacteria group bacterium]
MFVPVNLSEEITMPHPIPLETLKMLAEKIAPQKGISQQEATLELIHEQGHENVDFSGGIRASSDDTILVQVPFGLRS